MGKNAYLNVKKSGCLIWGLLIGFFMVGIILTVVGAFALSSPEDDQEFKAGVVGIVGGILSMVLPIIAVVKIIRDYKKYKNGETTIGGATEGGVLTDKIIRKHVRVGKNSKAVNYLSVSALLIFFIVFALFVSEEPITGDIKVWILSAAAVVMLGCGIKEIILHGGSIEYHVEEDRIAKKEMASTLTTLTPVLYLEKYGKYTIDPTHFHRDCLATMIYDMLDEDEEIYTVYSNSNNRLIQIYRKKHWSLGER